MATRALNTSLLLLFLSKFGRGEPTKNFVGLKLELGMSSEGYVDAYGPAYSNGLAEGTSEDTYEETAEGTAKETGSDYVEEETEAEGDYVGAFESYETARQDTPQTEQFPKSAMAMEDYKRMIHDKREEMAAVPHILNETVH